MASESTRISKEWIGVGAGTFSVFESLLQARPEGSQLGSRIMMLWPAPYRSERSPARETRQRSHDLAADNLRRSSLTPASPSRELSQSQTCYREFHQRVRFLEDKQVTIVFATETTPHTHLGHSSEVVHAYPSIIWNSLSNRSPSEQQKLPAMAFAFFESIRSVDVPAKFVYFTIYHPALQERVDQQDTADLSQVAQKAGYILHGKFHVYEDKGDPLKTKVFSEHVFIESQHARLLEFS